MTNSFFELLISFDLTLDISCLKLQKHSPRGFYFSSQQTNIVCEYKLNGKPTMN